MCWQRRKSSGEHSFAVSAKHQRSRKCHVTKGAFGKQCQQNSCNKSCLFLRHNNPVPFFTRRAIFFICRITAHKSDLDVYNKKEESLKTVNGKHYIYSLNLRRLFWKEKMIIATFHCNQVFAPSRQIFQNSSHFKNLSSLWNSFAYNNNLQNRSNYYHNKNM